MCRSVVTLIASVRVQHSPAHPWPTCESFGRGVPQMKRQMETTRDCTAMLHVLSANPVREAGVTALTFFYWSGVTCPLG
jgi:hypothetical protein